MGRWGLIAAYDLKANMLGHHLAAACVPLITPALFGVTALDAQSSAYPMELMMPLMGIALLTPVYAPERDKGLYGAVASRRTPYLAICGLRVALALAMMLAVTVLFAAFLRARACDVGMGMALAAFCGGVFLGGLGMLAAAASGNVVCGYMAPVLYLALDLMGGRMPLTLFSVMREGVMEGKAALLAAGIACIIASAALRHALDRRG